MTEEPISDELVNIAFDAWRNVFRRRGTGLEAVRAMIAAVLSELERQRLHQRLWQQAHEPGTITLPESPFGTSATWADYDWRGMSLAPVPERAASLVFRLIADAVDANHVSETGETGRMPCDDRPTDDGFRTARNHQEY